MKKTPAEIQQIARWIAAADLGLLVLSTPDEVIRLGRDGPSGEPSAERAAGPSGAAVRAASVGVFLLRHPGRTVPLPGAGERVAAGQPIGLLQIGPLLLPVAAPGDGEVIGVRAPDGVAVGFGAALFDFQAL
ncbi:MAG TPA: acetyl-CoA carboxylase biotin carboxyl carrier protein subunit [Variovorax sp.]|jgi:acetyl-CoA carboxylase biotin carboxyl carrier protein